ncbi:MAG: hypothetical protein IJ481_02650 [Alphaproteobacteria bacterium]|nr:hypothetical protein [Alphaproteobacteria bacterium]
MNFLKTLLFGCCLLGFANVKATEQFVKIGEPIIFARGETYGIYLQVIDCNSNESYSEAQPLWTDIPQLCSSPESDTSIPVRSVNAEPWKDNEKLFSDLKFEDYDQK